MEDEIDKISVFEKVIMEDEIDKISILEKVIAFLQNRVHELQKGKEAFHCLASSTH